MVADLRVDILVARGVNLPTFTLQTRHQLYLFQHLFSSRSLPWSVVKIKSSNVDNEISNMNGGSTGNK